MTASLMFSRRICFCYESCEREVTRLRVVNETHRCEYPDLFKMRQSKMYQDVETHLNFYSPHHSQV